MATERTTMNKPMGFWLLVMIAGNAASIAIAEAVKGYDLLLGHTVGIALIFTTTLLCVDQMARVMK
jgi:hypothetical protein